MQMGVNRCQLVLLIFGRFRETQPRSTPFVGRQFVAEVHHNICIYFNVQLLSLYCIHLVQSVATTSATSLVSPLHTLCYTDWSISLPTPPPFATPCAATPSYLKLIHFHYTKNAIHSIPLLVHPPNTAPIKICSSSINLAPHIF